MSQPTLRRRLEQIAEYNLPHIVQAGDTLPTKPHSQIRVIGYLDGNIPELTLPLYHPNLKNPFPKENGKFFPCNHISDIARAAGSDVQTKKVEARGWDIFGGVEVHAIYDPSANLTHYFLMPEIQR